MANDVYAEQVALMQTRPSSTRTSNDGAIEVAGLCRLASTSPSSSPASRERLAETLAASSTLRATSLGGITALVGEPDDGIDELEEALLQRHELLLQLGREFDTIPVRWGARVESVDWLDARLEERRAAIDATFDRLAGCVERVLRIPRSEELSERRPPDPEGSGRAYLERRRDNLERPPPDDDEQWSYWRSNLDDWIRDVSAVVRPDESCEWYPRPHLELTLLVPEAREPTLVDRVRSAVRSDPIASLVLTRPLPPYSFARVDWTSGD